jgi:hypothetical protein
LAARGLEAEAGRAGRARGGNLGPAHWPLAVDRWACLLNTAELVLYAHDITHEIETVPADWQYLSAACALQHHCKPAFDHVRAKRPRFAFFLCAYPAPDCAPCMPPRMCFFPGDPLGAYALDEGVRGAKSSCTCAYSPPKQARLLVYIFVKKISAQLSE